MALRLRFTEGDVEYEVDDYFIDILKSLPSKVGMEIASQIDWNAEYLPETDTWTNIYAGVVKRVEPPVFFAVEYIKEKNENTIYIDLEIIDSDTYLDYHLLNQILI